MIQLYDVTLSGNCHKVPMMLGRLRLEHRSVTVNLAAVEQKSSEFLTLNPFGQVPAIEDGETVLRDSQAILVYLARACGGAQ